MKRKNYAYIVIVVCIMLSFLSCEKDKEMELSTLSVTNEELVASYTSVSVSCQIKSESTLRNVYLHYATSDDFMEYKEVQMKKEKKGYSAQVSDLLDNTTYYVRYSASNSYSSIIGTDISRFTTLAASLPFIQLDSVFAILDTCAKARVTLKADGNAPILEMGVCWDVEQEPTYEHNRNAMNEGVPTVSVISLKPNTKYYVRAYAKNKVGIAYSESVSFFTLDLPKVQTNDITNIQITTALLNGSLIFNGNDIATVKGFCWSENPQPTISNDYSQVTTNGSEFSYQLSNLKDKTKYYVRAYAKNKIGVAYGEEKSFTTEIALPPTVKTLSASNISSTSATVGGNVTSDGGAAVTERGVVYSTSPNPTTSSSTKVTSGSGTGSFTCNISRLNDNTTYYIRAYAKNRKAISYGEEKVFTTNAYNLPTITTSSATNISYTSATVGGNVTSNGGAAVTERGVVYSTTPNPTTSSSTKVASGSGTGSFNCNLSNLQEGTTYYVRAYAKNEVGTSYGEQRVFTTVKSYSLPTITTSSATNISYTSATVGGNVTSDGGAAVTERGVVYSTTLNPTTSSSTKVTSGSGTGSFSCNLTNLQEGTTYYVRAYAKNEVGISYGEERVFATVEVTYFSVSSTEEVMFSPGNLQYHPFNKKWRFAPSQLDYIGDANSKISSTYNGWIDLFGWGTGNNPTNSSCVASEYKSFVDWGQNRIDDYAPNTWRTLTESEWDYLLNARLNAKQLQGVAQVDGVNGLILLPDNWICPTGITFKSGCHSSYGSQYYANYQTFTADQWSKLEAAGAIFLPAAGIRYCSGRVDYVGTYGGYCSSTPDGSDGAWYRYFDSGAVGMSYGGRDRGRSVRLVKNL